MNKRILHYRLNHQLGNQTGCVLVRNIYGERNFVLVTHSLDKKIIINVAHFLFDCQELHIAVNTHTKQIR